jgi:hypothetical protein
MVNGIGFNVAPMILTMINHSQDEGGIFEGLVMADVLVGMDMQEGGYYQTYFQIPSATQAGLYESYTCTSEFSNYSDTSDFFDVLSYEGTSLFSEVSQTGPWNKFMGEDLIEDQDLVDYWITFEDLLPYKNESDPSGVDARACIAGRTIGISGASRQKAELENPAELAWADAFKYQHTYEIKSGWRLWDSATAKEPTDGYDVSKPWKFEVDCGDYGCIGSGAVTMASSALVLAATLLAY